MTTKAQDAVIDGMAAEGMVFVKPLRLYGTEYSTVFACVLNEKGRRTSPWTLIAEDGVIVELREDSDEQVVCPREALGGPEVNGATIVASNKETT